jgi:glycosyltransferase involved in cell wall biosynthesis
MKILLIHNYYQVYGGEDAVLSQEYQLLQKNGHEVSQYTRHNEEINRYNLFKKILFLSSILFNFKTIFDLRKQIKIFSPDVAHVHNVFPLISPSVYIYLKFRKIPIIQTIHNYRFVCSNGLFFVNGKICERCFKFNLTPLFKRCFRNNFALSLFYSMTIFFYRFTGIYSACISKFSCLTEFSRAKMIKAGYPKDKMVIKPNFFASVRNEVSIALPDRKGKYCFYIGRLSDEKGLKTLLDAFQNSASIKLVVAGYGPLENFVKNRISDNIEFIGFVKDAQKNEFIKGAEFVIVPSEWYESFPMAVVEANSLKVMILASCLGSLAELIKEGKTGLLFKPGDVDDLKEKVDFLSQHPEECRRMGDNAYHFTQTYFSKENNYKILMSIYESVLPLK